MINLIMSKLFDDNVDSDSDTELKINEGYANNYQNWRHKEELNKLKTKYGEHLQDLDSTNEESESSSEDDEEGNELTEEFEKDFYKTLACLKNKDPKIYDENVTFFSQPEASSENNANGEAKKKSKKEKALFLRDYERKIVTERGGKFSDSEDEEDFRKKNKEANTLTYVEEQKKLKDSIKEALKDDDSDDGLLQPKERSEADKQREDESYKEWLKGQRAEIESSEKEALKPLRDFWTDPNLDENEKFLRDYVLNKRFLERDTGDYAEYEDRVHDSDENLSEDEKNIEQQEVFEHKYNFRFEEPDQEFIKRYPRTMENSLRKKDTRRAEKRAEVKNRKEEEKLRKQEELKQLKALKRKEIADKIAQLREITGNDDMQFDSIDLDGDFDPAEHDRKMQQLFNEDYYADEAENVKPEFPDIDEELGIESTWDNYDPNAEEIEPEAEGNEPHCEDANFNMDADYDVNRALQGELVGSSKKKRRRRSKFAEMISKEKPKFDPSVHSSYKDYIDQYYALDYEDMIGDLPCRFKYRSVVPNDYGLTVEEILTADDRELNKWCSLKKALEHKSEHQEMNEVKIYKQKAQNEAHKKKILQSLYKAEESEGEVEGEKEDNSTSKKKRRRKKKKSGITPGNEMKPSISVDGKADKTTNGEIDVKPVNKKRKAGKEGLALQNGTGKPDSKKVKAEYSEEIEANQKIKKKKKGNASIQESDKCLKKTEDGKSKKEKRKEKFQQLQKSKQISKDPVAAMSDERLKAYGINPKNFRNKLKYGKQR